MFRLAMALGKTLGEVMAMPLTEIRGWMAYQRIEPFGSPADDYRAGLPAAVTLNMNRKKGAKPTTPYALMPWRAPRVEKVEMTPEQEAQFIREQFNAAGKASDG